MKLPSYPQSLKELPKFCREVIDYLRASHINNVVNGLIKESPSGSTIVCGVGVNGNKNNKRNLYHPWKVTDGGVDPEDDTLHTWNYVGGTVYACGQGADITVADGSVDTSVPAADVPGFVVLVITRDDATRELLTATVEFTETVADSDYTTQYRVLAEVGYDVPVLQLQFEEMRIWEDLAVVNGEFNLLGLELSHRNTYEPPA